MGPECSNGGAAASSSVVRILDVVAAIAAVWLWGLPGRVVHACRVLRQCQQGGVETADVYGARHMRRIMSVEKFEPTSVRNSGH